MDAETRQRVAERVTPAEGGCLLWTGGCDAAGYPRIAVGRRMRLVRRLVVEDALAAPLGWGIVVTDRCSNRRCVALSHLRVTTVAEIRARADRCSRGHAPDWYVAPDGARQCRACRAAGQRRRRAALRANA